MHVRVVDFVRICMVNKVMRSCGRMSHWSSMYCLYWSFNLDISYLWFKFNIVRLSVNIINMFRTAIWYFNNLSVGLSISWLIIIGNRLLIDHRLFMPQRSWNLNVAGLMPRRFVMSIFSMFRNLNDACMLC